MIRSDLKLPLLAHHGVVDGDRDVIGDAFQPENAVYLAAVGAVADAEVHCAVVFFPFAYRVVVLLAELVEPDGYFATHQPGIFIAIFLEELPHLSRFGLALNVDAAPILDDQSHRMSPAPRR